MFAYVAELLDLKSHSDPEFMYVLLLFALLFALIFLFLPTRLTPVKPLGKERKGFAFFVIFVGLGTFFSPMVILNPPLLNRAQWSPFQILAAVYTGQLPVSQGHFDETCSRSLCSMCLYYWLSSRSV